MVNALAKVIGIMAAEGNHLETMIRTLFDELKKGVEVITDTDATFDTANRAKSMLAGTDRTVNFTAFDTMHGNVSMLIQI